MQYEYLSATRKNYNRRQARLAAYRTVQHIATILLFAASATVAGAGVVFAAMVIYNALG